MRASEPRPGRSNHNRKRPQQSPRDKSSAATGTGRVPAAPHGHQSGMGGDDAARRRDLKRDLTRETRRLIQHIGHLGVKEIDLLEGVVDDLRQVHADDEKCMNLARHHGDRSPPWGTRYASAVERWWYAVRDAFTQK